MASKAKLAFVGHARTLLFSLMDGAAFLSEEQVVRACVQVGARTVELFPSVFIVNITRNKILPVDG